MTAEDAVERVLAMAHAFKHVTEHAGPNRGESVDEFIRYCGLDPAKRHPWCMAYPSYCGGMALGSAWPFEPTASCYWFGQWAKELGVLLCTAKLAALLDTEQWANALLDTSAVSPPRRGDVLLVYKPKKHRFGHAALVTGFDGTTVETLEGNSNKSGSAEGNRVVEYKRTEDELLAFVRWPSLIR